MAEEYEWTDYSVYRPIMPAMAPQEPRTEALPQGATSLPRTENNAPTASPEAPTGVLTAQSRAPMPSERVPHKDELSDADWMENWNIQWERVIKEEGSAEETMRKWPGHEGLRFEGGGEKLLFIRPRPGSEPLVSMNDASPDPVLAGQQYAMSKIIKGQPEQNFPEIRMGKGAGPKGKPTNDNPEDGGNLRIARPVSREDLTAQMNKELRDKGTGTIPWNKHLEAARVQSKQKEIQDLKKHIKSFDVIEFDDLKMLRNKLNSLIKE